MPTRWEVEEAVFTSSIEPGGRHILLTLLSRSNAATAEVPSKHVPTFDELEVMTGLARSTLIEWMKTLTEAKWIVREVLEGERRTGMRILSGDPKAERIKRIRKSKTDDAPYRDAVQTDGPKGGSEGAADVPPRGTAHTATRYADVPPRGMPDDPHLLKDFPTESRTPTDLDGAADAADSDGGFAGLNFGPRVDTKPKTPAEKAESAPKQESVGQRVNRISRLYTDKVKLVDFHGVRQAVDAAFKSGDYTEEQITKAIEGLTERRDPVTRTSLRIAIEGLPSWVNPAKHDPATAARNSNGRRGNRHVPYRDPDDISVYKTSKI